MVFHAGFPQFLGFPVVCQFEADGREVPLELAWTDLHEKVVPLVRDLEDFGPGKPIDSQSENSECHAKFFKEHAGVN